jgi:hypothetical protein
MMPSNFNHIVGTERTKDMHNAAEYSRVVAAARERRTPQRERAERRYRLRIFSRRSPKLA